MQETDKTDAAEAAAQLLGAEERGGVPQLKGFARIEMIACRQCGRANPPTREGCLYCGMILPQQTPQTEREVEATQIALPSRTLEEWEPGYNVILLPVPPTTFHIGAPPVVRAEIERMFGIDGERLARMIEGGVALPLARVGGEEEAGEVARRVVALNLPCEVLPDAELRRRADQIKRVRKLEIEGTALRLWSRAGEDRIEDAVTLDLAEIVALIRGRLFTSETETVTPHANRQISFNHDESKTPVEEREMASDESVLDIYAFSSPETWRISAGSFDYSCLGARRTLLARDNFELLVEALRLAASAARFDDSYHAARNLLEIAWSLTTHTEARGLKRETLGRFAKQAAKFTDNRDQFTRYARLSAHVERERRRRQQQENHTDGVPGDTDTHA